MGRAKLAIELADGLPLGQLALRSLSESGLLEEIFVVARPDDPLGWLSNTVKESSIPLRVVNCSDASEGMSRSLQCGINAALSSSAEAEATLVALADQPFVTAAMVRRLLFALQSDNGLHYAASANGEAAMPPAVFRRVMLPAFERLQGDAGARALFADRGWRGVALRGSEEDDQRLLDVDDESVLAAARIWYRHLF
ncbi:NTP transferase domain-containing protein [Paenibacillus sp. NPDC058071]|uniref:NTP transferase domain-containing protein n=1 Tax=Paenibacillus sp. NPDC058071 TaxID=3346326 RepID=UPI0036D9F18A